MTDQGYIELGGLLFKRAIDDNRPFVSFTNEWLRRCDDKKTNPLAEPNLILDLADIDRYCGNSLGEKEKNIEMQVFLQQERLKKKAKSE